MPTSEDETSASRPTYVVLKQNRNGAYTLVAEVPRQPGLTAKRARRAAIIEAIGRDPRDTETYAAIARSEWRIGSDW